jgi:hypothetical protein
MSVLENPRIYIYSHCDKIVYDGDTFLDTSNIYKFNNCLYQLYPPKNYGNRDCLVVLF